MSGWTTCIVCWDEYWSDCPSDEICGASCLREFEEQCLIDEMEEAENDGPDQASA